MSRHFRARENAEGCSAPGSRAQLKSSNRCGYQAKATRDHRQRGYPPLSGVKHAARVQNQSDQRAANRSDNGYCFPAGLGFPSADKVFQRLDDIVCHQMTVSTPEVDNSPRGSLERLTAIQTVTWRAISGRPCFEAFTAAHEILRRADTGKSLIKGESVVLG